jgi:mannose/fructose-specific phosphotransferase system component IIA
MRRIIIATHGRLAQGYQDSIEMICGKKEQVSYMCFYTENTDYDGEIQKYMESLSDGDEVLICTDMFSGSVNQKFLPFLEKPNVFMITGINLPLVLELVMYKGELSRKIIDSFIKGGASELYYVDIEKLKEDSGGDFFENSPGRA